MTKANKTPTKLSLANFAEHELDIQNVLTA